MSTHDDLREHAASYVLGSLSPGERVEFEEHLDTCERCRAEVLDFAPIPALLSLVDLDDLVDPPRGDLSDAVVERARADLRRLQGSRRRWQRAAGVAAAALVLAASAALFARGNDSGGPDRDQIALSIQTEEATIGDIVADERPWGTYVHLSLDGLPERRIYRLWAVDETGGWHEAGSWLPTPDGSARLGGSTHLRLAEIALLVVTSDDPDDQLLTAR
jgi:anti-sigma-K factor RskA